MTSTSSMLALHLQKESWLLLMEPNLQTLKRVVHRKIFASVYWIWWNFYQHQMKCCGCRMSAPGRQTTYILMMTSPTINKMTRYQIWQQRHQFLAQQTAPWLLKMTRPIPLGNYCSNVPKTPNLDMTSPAANQQNPPQHTNHTYFKMMSDDDIDVTINLTRTGHRLLPRNECSRMQIPHCT